MAYIALFILISTAAWGLGLLISTLARGSSGLLSVMATVYSHPSKVVLIAAIIAAVIAFFVLAYTNRYTLTLLTLPPVFLGSLLMVYQCLDMKAWYLRHYPYASFRGDEPFYLVFFSVLFLFKAAVISGISLFPALYSLDYGVRGKKRRGSALQTDVVVITLVCLTVLAIFALISTTTGFGMHFFKDGYLKYLF